MTEPRCFYCDKLACDLEPVLLCDSCRSHPMEESHAHVPTLVPSSSIDELSAAIGKETGSISWARRPVHTYYHSMLEWLRLMDRLDEVPDYSQTPCDTKTETSFCVRCATYCSFGLNFMLLCGKGLAMSTSSSYTIMSSLADSCLDIIGGIIISCTAANSGYSADDAMKYPAGKSRVSTVGILVFSVLMSCCALYIILACVNSLIGHELAPPTTAIAVFVMAMTIVVKFSMWAVYTWIGHPITLTLAEDHRNDVLTNGLGLFMYWGGARLRWWMDSTGGILLSLFVLNSWARNAVENAKMMMGQGAPPEVIRNLTYVAAHHHPLIKAVDKVVAYQLGPMYFAEVFVVLRDGISFEAARWIGDTLTLRLTLVPDIERAYVHLDTPSHDLTLEKLLEEGAKHGMRYARDARTGQIVFNLSDDPNTV